MLGLLSCALNRVINELCQEKSSNHEKHGWNFYAKVVFLQPLLLGYGLILMKGSFCLLFINHCKIQNRKQKAFIDRKKIDCII